MASCKPQRAPLPCTRKGSSTLNPAAVTIAAAVATQYAFSHLPSAKAFDWRSPLITGLSLSLLLRTPTPLLWVLAPVLGIGSKFLIPSNGKHFFNPATFSVVALLLLSQDGWGSAGTMGP